MNANRIIGIRNDAKEFTIQIMLRIPILPAEILYHQRHTFLESSFKNVGTGMEFLHQLLLLLIMTYLKMLIDPFQQKMQ